jgi:hypothetical protein
MPTLTPSQRQLLAYWLPALIGGAIAWLTFIAIGQTPLVRASGLALVIVGVSITLRRFGAAFAVTGGLALAYCPAFWSQTGGGQNAPATIVLAVIIAGVTVALIIGFAKRPYLAIAVGLIIFAVIFWSQIGTPRSLRLTSLLTAWLLYLLIDSLRLTNLRPDDPPPDHSMTARHTLGMLLLLALGVLNDPLLTLLIPAVVLGLLLSRKPLSSWYWAALLIVIVIGLRGIFVQYVNDYWWLYPVDASTNLRVPYILIGGWHEASRWVGLFELVIVQFSGAGLVLGILGLSRLARWDPSLGIVTMVAYAAYALFGLVYFGADRAILLLPLLIIQVIWMTYAVYAFGEWLHKSLSRQPALVTWFAPTAFAIMPLVMLARIIGVS